MSSTVTQTESYSYTAADVEKVVRRFTADILMIASSSGAMSEDEARKYAHDIELLAKAGYLRSVDVTLLGSGNEVRAVHYDVVTGSGDLENDRPGNVLWPKVADPFLRVIIWYTNAYTPEIKRQFSLKLKVGWSPSQADTSHAALTGGGGREYSSNGFGMSRKDYQ